MRETEEEKKKREEEERKADELAALEVSLKDPYAQGLPKTPPVKED